LGVGSAFLTGVGSVFLGVIASIFLAGDGAFFSVDFLAEGAFFGGDSFLAVGTLLTTDAFATEAFLVDLGFSPSSSLCVMKSLISGIVAS
jgi:hypothetical protein